MSTCSGDHMPICPHAHMFGCFDDYMLTCLYALMFLHAWLLTCPPALMIVYALMLTCLDTYS